MSQCNGETREENRKSFGTQGSQEAAERSEKCTKTESMKTPDDDRNWKNLVTFIKITENVQGYLYFITTLSWSFTL